MQCDRQIQCGSGSFTQPSADRACRGATRRRSCSTSVRPRSRSSAHSGSSAARIASTTSWCSWRFFADAARRRAAGLVGRGVGQSRCGSGERCDRSHAVAAAAPPAAPGLRRPARSPNTRRRPRSDPRERHWPRGLAATSRCTMVRASSGPSATSRNARASTTLCRPLAGSRRRSSAAAMRARCSLGLGKCLRDVHRRKRAQRPFRQRVEELNRLRADQRRRLGHVKWQGAQNNWGTMRCQGGPCFGELSEMRCAHRRR